MRIPVIKIEREKDRKEEITQAESGSSLAPGNQRRKWQNIWQLGALLSLVGASVMLLRYLNLYPIAREEPSVTEIGNIGVCTRYNYVLYRDLYNAVNSKFLTFEKLYGETDEEEPELMLSEAIYAVLVASVAVAGNLHSALWSVAAYTVILCFSLFMTGNTG